MSKLCTSLFLSSNYVAKRSLRLMSYTILCQRFIQQTLYCRSNIGIWITPSILSWSSSCWLSRNKMSFLRKIIMLVPLGSWLYLDQMPSFRKLRAPVTAERVVGSPVGKERKIMCSKEKTSSKVQENSRTRVCRLKCFWCGCSDDCSHTYTTHIT